MLFFCEIGRGNKVNEMFCIQETVLFSGTEEEPYEMMSWWAISQESRVLHFVNATFHTLQKLPNQCQEELRCLATELHSKAEILRDIESHKS